MYKNFLRIGKLEGYSFLFLLLIAMPVRSLFQMPEIVRYAGLAHGILFIWFMLIILGLVTEKKLSGKQAFYALLLSIIPFGTFYLSRILPKASVN